MGAAESWRFGARSSRKATNTQTRNWRTLGHFCDVTTALQAISTQPPRYTYGWKSKLYYEKWIRRSPKDEKLKPDSRGIKKVVVCCASHTNISNSVFARSGGASRGLARTAGLAAGLKRSKMV